MRAAIHTRYGPPEVVEVREVDKPAPGDREVLVRVEATSVTRTDCGFRRPDPFFVRLFSGLRRPRRQILGSELAGEVDAVGAGVTAFRPGDPVFGLSPDTFGAHAEYVCLSEDGRLTRKPSNMSYEEAGAVCDGAMIASRCLSRATVERGQRILIYGASGSIGTAAVQLAKHLGAEVVAVCNTKNVEVVRSLGADEVIDYTKEDFTAGGRIFDAIFDAVGKLSFARCRRLLKRGGVYVATDLGFLWHAPALVLATALTSRLGGRRVLLPIPRVEQRDIVRFRELIEAGALRAVIDRRYPLERIVDAYRYVESEQKTGNVVVTIGRGARAG